MLWRLYSSWSLRQIISDEIYILFYLLFILGSGLTEAQIRRQEIELFQNIKEEYICGYRTGADYEVLGCRKLNYSRIYGKEGFIG
jgi:hypothetical protein